MKVAFWVVIYVCTLALKINEIFLLRMQRELCLSIKIISAKAKAKAKAKKKEGSNSTICTRHHFIETVLIDPPKAPTSYISTGTHLCLFVARGFINYGRGCYPAYVANMCDAALCKCREKKSPIHYHEAYNYICVSTLLAIHLCIRYVP